MKKKLTQRLLFLFQLIMLLHCSSIASLPQEPEPPTEHTLKNLSIYESELASYILYLETFLIRTNRKFGDSNFPKFTLFDTNILQTTQTLDAIKANIKHFKHYINVTKPIAIFVYNKYSKFKK
ncbi:hypothetical protein F9Y90_04270 (plasmid) [Borrelia miyamotoi]|uniref:Outer surface protein n=2 Tax=Borrelia miyamotoi TaxID=47466 RepID=A0AAP9CG49_9SPIR|nr:BBA14 family lipoprotein [Borrelia miyamotoi]AHH05488.1 Outer surface protein [Borrelia miyamotoi FR64b]ATQ15280.1 hypothetical protein CNO14_04580 [Borrelia miyamotoi]ATQ16409.1 hypothetical protein CNO13_04290 [Borrelia miyamotoi]ATQ18853.1 hypothetical protein CNO11_04575 [Borrelia miyamotoi]QBK62390.1 hypothetical protein EZU67_04265 [Borrelia miyamotoi]